MGRRHQRVDAGGAQQRAGADQRQADQGRRVVGLDRIEQGDAQRFALRAAGAVIRLFGAQVVLDLGVGQVAKAHRDGGQRAAGKAARFAHHGHGGVEHDAATAHAPQLFHRALVGAGFADGFAVEFGHLVRADHDGIRVRGSHGPRLGQCQPRGEDGRGFAGPRRLVDIGRRHLERQAKALQQFAPVARRGTEDQRAARGHREDCPIVLWLASCTVH